MHIDYVVIADEATEAEARPRARCQVHCPDNVDHHVTSSSYSVGGTTMPSSRV